MNCPVCGMRLPDGSDLCLYCGSKIESPANEAPSAANPPAPADAMPPAAETPVPEKKPDSSVKETIDSSGMVATVYVSSAAADKTEVNETDEPLKTARRGAAPKKWIAAVVCLSVLLLASVGINIYQYADLRIDLADIADLLTSKQKADLSNLKKDITAIKENTAMLENAAEDVRDSVDGVCNKIDRELEQGADRTILKADISELKQTVMYFPDVAAVVDIEMLSLALDIEPLPDLWVRYLFADDRLK